MRNLLQTTAVVILALSFAAHSQAAGLPSLGKGTVEIKATKTGGQTLDFSSPNQKGTVTVTIEKNGSIAINTAAIPNVPSVKLDLKKGKTANEMTLTASVTDVSGKRTEVVSTSKGKGAASFAKLFPQFPVGTFDLSVLPNLTLTGGTVTWTNQATNKAEFTMSADFSNLSSNSLDLTFENTVSKEKTSATISWDTVSKTATASATTTKAGKAVNSNSCDFGLGGTVATTFDAKGNKSKESTINDQGELANEKTFDANGKLQTETTYANGKVKSKKTFDAKGKVKQETDADGKPVKK